MKVKRRRGKKGGGWETGNKKRERRNEKVKRKTGMRMGKGKGK
jgi:hypothetical protein